MNMTYKVVVSTAAEKSLMRLPGGDYNAVRQVISSLSDQPWPVKLRKIVGSDLFRLRFGQYCVIYTVDTIDRCVYIERITGRNEKTYRGL